MLRIAVEAETGIKTSCMYLVTEEAMADDKTKRGAADRRKVAAGEGYEVSYFARKHSISKEQALKLIAKVGNDRAKLNAAAEKLKK